MLPKIAEGDANKLWIIPSELNDALKGLGGIVNLPGVGGGNGGNANGGNGNGGNGNGGNGNGGSANAPAPRRESPPFDKG
jgi:hypothetical protein